MSSDRISQLYEAAQYQAKHPQVPHYEFTKPENAQTVMALVEAYRAAKYHLYGLTDCPCTDIENVDSL